MPVDKFRNKGGVQREQKALITACAEDTAKPAAGYRKALLLKTTRKRPDSGQRKIRFYGSAIRGIYGSATLQRNFMRWFLFLSTVLSACSIRTRLRNGNQTKTCSLLMKGSHLSAKSPGLSAELRNGISSVIQDRDRHKKPYYPYCPRKSKAAANRIIPVDSPPLHFMISSALRSNHTYGRFRPQFSY